MFVASSSSSSSPPWPHVRAPEPALALTYVRSGDALVFTCDVVAIDGGWLDVPFEAWKDWSALLLDVRPGPGAPAAELVLSDLRGRYLRDGEGRACPVRSSGALVRTICFHDRARGMTFRVGARAGSASGDLRVFMGLTGHGSLGALNFGPLRPTPARVG